MRIKEGGRQRGQEHICCCVKVTKKLTIDELEKKKIEIISPFFDVEIKENEGMMVRFPTDVRQGQMGSLF